MPIYLYLYKRLSLNLFIFLPIPIDVYSRLHSHVYRLCSHAKLLTLACVSYGCPLIVACVSIHLSLSGCVSVLSVDYSTCRWQLDNGGLAPWSTGDRGGASERAQEAARADGEMRAQLDRQQRQRECFLIIDDLIATFDLCAAGTLAFRVACWQHIRVRGPGPCTVAKDMRL